VDIGITFQQLFVALGLGLLVGLQKERADAQLAGVRTFALVTMFGAICAQLSIQSGFWIVVVGLVAITALVVVGNVVGLEQDRMGPGQTTEVAVLIMYVVGAYVVMGQMIVAVVVGAVVAVLLHLKEQLHEFADQLADKDFRAIMQFVVISLVILPILPNQTYGPYDVLNPRQIWWMVVLIVGINLAGYAASRLMGQRSGTVVAGILGGVISSTATTAVYSRKAAEGVDTRVASAVIWIASSVVFVRVLIEISAVAPGFLPVAAPPIGILLGVFVVMTVALARRNRDEADEVPSGGNPSELKPALIFGALYGLILFAVAAAEDLLGGAGIYAVAALSGLTDMDAITLSTAQLVNVERLDPSVAWRAIVLASLSNIAFKLGIVAMVAGRPLFRRLLGLMAVPTAVGVALMLFWG